MNAVYLLCSISRQAHHQALGRQRRQAEAAPAYVRLMEQVRALHPGMGLRTIYELCRPEGIGRDAFIALGLCEGFRLHAVRKVTRTTFSVKCHQYTNLLSGREFRAINQIWASDITYVHCEGRFYYLAMVMDVYSRRIIGYSLAEDMRAERNYAALKMALQLRGVSDYGGSLIHHSDMGSQYASDLYTETLEGHGICISMCEQVWENTHMERVNGTIKNQYLERMEISSAAGLHKKVGEVIHTYNHLRPHKSLGGRTPAEYERWLGTIPMEQRTILKIYTTTKQQNTHDPNQLKLSFPF